MPRWSFVSSLVLAATAMVFPVTPTPAFALNDGDMIGAWKYTCARNPCQVFIGIAQAGDVGLIWSLERDHDKGQATSIIRVPLGVALPPGLRIYTDDTTFFELRFQVCKHDGCTAALVMDDAMQAAIAAKTVVRVAYLRYDEAQAKSVSVAFEVPVRGFKDALDAL